MCDNVIFHDEEKKTAATQGELAAIIGRDNIVMEPPAISEFTGERYSGAVFVESDCLCPVDLIATAKKCGYEHSRRDEDGENDYFDFHWRKTTESKGEPT